MFQDFLIRLKSAKRKKRSKWLDILWWPHQANEHTFQKLVENIEKTLPNYKCISGQFHIHMLIIYRNFTYSLRILSYLVHNFANTYQSSQCL